MFRTGNVCHTLDVAGFHTVEPDNWNRVASAITRVVVVAGPSPSTTFPAVHHQHRRTAHPLTGERDRPVRLLPRHQAAAHPHRVGKGGGRGRRRQRDALLATLGGLECPPSNPMLSHPTPGASNRTNWPAVAPKKISGVFDTAPY